MKKKLLKLLSGVMAAAMVAGSLFTPSMKAKAADCEDCEQVLETTVYAEDDYIDADPDAEHPYIKGQCQIPYDMVAPGEDGYLIGFQTYESNPSWTYQMLILDCTTMAWVYATDMCHVPEDCFWTVWQPEYGFFWTLFSLRDENGKEIDRVCYGFKNEVEKKNTASDDVDDTSEITDMSAFKVGDLITLGTYKDAPIEWYILEINGTEAVVLSKEVLSYNEASSSVPCTWETSSIRSWLNGDFYKAAFSKREQEIIKYTELNNGDEGRTTDKVYLLSLDEVGRYYGDQAVNLYPDEHTRLKIKDTEFAEGAWWLRSTNANDKRKTAYISSSGEICSADTAWGSYIGVRPTLTIELSKVAKSEQVEKTVLDKNIGSTVNVGDCIAFGEYRGRTIEWYVVEKSGSEVVLLSKEVLVEKTYYSCDTWEKSELRRWLNEYFYVMAFDANEKKHIVTSYLENEDNPYYGEGKEGIEKVKELDDTDGHYVPKEGGEATKDNVYILSFADMEKYFGISVEDYKRYDNKELSEEEYTKTCVDKSPLIKAQYNDKDCGWWMRTPAYDFYWGPLTHCFNTGIRENGMIELRYVGYRHSSVSDKHGFGGYTDIIPSGIRPVIRISFE